jgi:hypothetical protein
MIGMEEICGVEDDTKLKLGVRIFLCTKLLYLEPNPMEQIPTSKTSTLG